MEEDFSKFFEADASKFEEPKDLPTDAEVEHSTEVAEAENPVSEAAEESSEQGEAVNEPKTGSNRGIPVSALQEERRKAQEWKSEVASLRAEIQKLQPAQAAPVSVPTTQASIPDPYDDPNAYNQYVQNEIARATSQQIALHNLTTSRDRAVIKHGQDTINEVAEWAQAQANANPSFEAQIFAQADPAEWLIDQKNRHDEFEAFRTDPATFFANYAASNGFAAAQTTATQNPIKAPKGPASINSTKGRNEQTAVDVKQGYADAFDNIFKR